MKKIWIAIVKLMGWKFFIPDKKERPEIAHCVLIMAPHTAVADYFVGAAVMFAAGTNPRIFIKKEFFNFITRPLLKTSRWTAATGRTTWCSAPWTS